MGEKREKFQLHWSFPSDEGRRGNSHTNVNFSLSSFGSRSTLITGSACPGAREGGESSTIWVVNESDPKFSISAVSVVIATQTSAVPENSPREVVFVVIEQQMQHNFSILDDIEHRVLQFPQQRLCVFVFLQLH